MSLTTEAVARPLVLPFAFALDELSVVSTFWDLPEVIVPDWTGLIKS
jgi:hypothetical protein